jgi:pilus assembly protein Flp/PilA
MPCRMDRKENLMGTPLRRFLTDEKGATAIEYGLIAAGISLAIIAVVQGIGTALDKIFTNAFSALR